MTAPDAPSGDSAVVAGRAAMTAGISGWQRSVDRNLQGLLLHSITVDWQRGWQPAELVRQVERQFGSRHARLATDAVAAEMQGYAAAPVDDRWAAQLAALGAEPWWDHDDGYLTQWGARERIDRATVVSCVLQTLYALALVPELNLLCPLPGSAVPGTLPTAHGADQPVTGDAA